MVRMKTGDRCAIRRWELSVTYNNKAVFDLESLGRRNGQPMKYENGHFAFSATDLACHLSCEQLNELERRLAEGDSARGHYHLARCKRAIRASPHREQNAISRSQRRHHRTCRPYLLRRSQNGGVHDETGEKWRQPL